MRARDVQILFADAATGARSPALVHQGKIGEIIQAKPEQRRRVLEDAAGVAGLHARRHEAELRLKAAETNLTRVEDVIGQLAGQIDGLKKQARQAIRYREVAAKVRKAEATLFHLRWLEANADVGGSRAHPRPQRSRDGRAHPRAGRKPRASRRSAPPNCRRCARPKPAPRPDCSGSPMRARLLDREEERAKERVAELDRRLTQFAADIAREQQQTSDAEVALQRLDTEDAELKEEIKSRVEKRCGVDERVSEAEATLAARRAPVRRADHGARRPHRQAQPARGRRAHPSRPAGAARSGDRQRRRPTSKSWRRRPAVSATSPHSPAPWRPRSRAWRSPKPRRRPARADHVAARAEARSFRAPLDGGRQARAAARDRSAHDLKTRQRRDQEPVAADHRRRHGRQGL